MPDIAQIEVRVTENGTRSATDSLNVLEGSFTKAAAAGAGFATGTIVITTALGAIRGALNQVNDAARDLQLARTLGLSASELSGFSRAAQVFTGDSRAASNALDQLAQAAARNDPVLRALHVSATTTAGGMRPLTEITLDVADALASLPDKQLAAAAGAKLLGESNRAAVGWLIQGRSAITQQIDDVTKLGAVYGNEFSQKAEQFEQSSRRVGLAWTALEVRLGAAILPAVAQAMERFDALVRRTGGLGSALSTAFLNATSGQNPLGPDTPPGTARPLAAHTPGVFPRSGTEVENAMRLQQQRQELAGQREATSALVALDEARLKRAQELRAPLAEQLAIESLIIAHKREGINKEIELLKNEKDQAGIANQIKAKNTQLETLSFEQAIVNMTLRKQATGLQISLNEKIAASQEVQVAKAQAYLDLVTQTGRPLNEQVNAIGSLRVAEAELIRERIAALQQTYNQRNALHLTLGDVQAITTEMGLLGSELTNINGQSNQLVASLLDAEEPTRRLVQQFAALANADQGKFTAGQLGTAQAGIVRSTFGDERNPVELTRNRLDQLTSAENALAQSGKLTTDLQSQFDRLRQNTLDGFSQIDTSGRTVFTDLISATLQWGDELENQLVESKGTVGEFAQSVERDIGKIFLHEYVTGPLFDSIRGSLGTRALAGGGQGGAGLLSRLPGIGGLFGGGGTAASLGGVGGGGTFVGGSAPGVVGGPSIAAPSVQLASGAVVSGGVQYHDAATALQASVLPDQTTPGGTTTDAYGRTISPGSGGITAEESRISALFSRLTSSTPSTSPSGGGVAARSRPWRALGDTSRMRGTSGARFPRLPISKTRHSASSALVGTRCHRQRWPRLGTAIPLVQPVSLA